MSQCQDRTETLGVGSLRLDDENFCYRTTPPPLDPSDRKKVVSAILSSKRRPTGPNIRVFNQKSRALARNPQVRSAYRSLSSSIKRHTGARGPVDVLACEWAQPHSDQGFVGTIIYSAVLHTGAHDYVMQVFHTEHNSNGYEELIKTELLLRAGVAFIFDPTRVHFTSPLRPHQEALLVLLQVELDDCTDDARRAILERLPPVCDAPRRSRSDQPPSER